MSRCLQRSRQLHLGAAMLPLPLLLLQLPRLLLISLLQWNCRHLLAFKVNTPSP